MMPTIKISHNELNSLIRCYETIETNLQAAYDESNQFMNKEFDWQGEGRLAFTDIIAKIYKLHGEIVDYSPKVTGALNQLEVNFDGFISGSGQNSMIPLIDNVINWS